MLMSRSPTILSAPISADLGAAVLIVGDQFGIFARRPAVELCDGVRHIAWRVVRIPAQGYPAGRLVERPGWPATSCKAKYNRGPRGPDRGFRHRPRHRI